MKYLIPFLSLALSTTAFAGPDDPLDIRNQGPFYLRHHHHGEGRDKSSIEPHQVYRRFGRAKLPVFHRYHPFIVQQPYTATLPDTAYSQLPEFIERILTHNRIVSPKINVVFQEINEFDRDPYIFRPHYFFAPNTEEVNGQVAMDISWLAIQPDGGYGLMRQTIPTDSPNLVHEGGMTFHGPGDTVASPDNAHFNAPNPSQFSDFWTIARNNATGDSAVTLHWFLPTARTNMLSNEVLASVITTRDLITALRQRIGGDGEIAPENAINTFENLMNYDVDAARAEALLFETFLGSPRTVERLIAAGGSKTLVREYADLRFPERETTARGPSTGAIINDPLPDTIDNFDEWTPEQRKLLTGYLMANLNWMPKFSVESTDPQFMNLLAFALRDYKKWGGVKRESNERSLQRPESYYERFLEDPLNRQVFTLAYNPDLMARAAEAIREGTITNVNQLMGWTSRQNISDFHDERFETVLGAPRTLARLIAAGGAKALVREYADLRFPERETTARGPSTGAIINDPLPDTIDNFDEWTPEQRKLLTGYLMANLHWMPKLSVESTDPQYTNLLAFALRDYKKWGGVKRESNERSLQRPESYYEKLLDHPLNRQVFTLAYNPDLMARAAEAIREGTITTVDRLMQWTSRQGISD